MRYATRIRNATDTSGFDHENWIKYWENKTKCERTLRCIVEKCTETKNIVGAHVKIINKDGT